LTHLGYLITGWGITLGVLGVYAWRLVRRGRHLSVRVPDAHRRWLDDQGPDGA